MSSLCIHKGIHQMRFSSLILEPIIKKYTKIIDGVPVEITEKETREERIITGNL